ncbi:MAG TPA: hypothetical protein VF228_08585 [Iamia sp.]
MADLFLPAARPVVMTAEAHARSDGSETTGAHHVLLAVTSVPTSAAWALATRGLDEAVLRDALDRRCGVPFPTGDARVRPDPGAPRVPLSDEAKQVIAHSAVVARRRGRTRIEPADLGIAALESEAPTVVDALDELGLDAARLIAGLG